MVRELTLELHPKPIKQEKCSKIYHRLQRTMICSRDMILITYKPFRQKKMYLRLW